jgi:SSS family solute:Na+ symporter
MLWLVVKFDPQALAVLAFSANAKPMAENLYRFIWSWLVCVAVTILVSLATRPKPAAELQGLVYGFATLPSEETVPIYRRPIFAAALVAAVFVWLNWVFW